MYFVNRVKPKEEGEVMNKKRIRQQLRGKRGLLIMLLSIISTAVVAQEIDWFSIDGGGGISNANGTQLIGVIGQSDTVLMSAGNISLAGGYLPLPSSQDIIFKDGFE